MSTDPDEVALGADLSQSQVRLVATPAHKASSRKQSHRMVCCSKADVTGEHCKAVPAATLAYGILEYFTTADRLSVDPKSFIGLYTSIYPMKPLDGSPLDYI
jgi:hypothetical protein